ncbi:MAG: hypothetical protein ACRDF9_00055 [Candidatus Limnocylindria bacterium]
MKTELLDAAVDVAARNGATVEGWLIGDTYTSAETFEGREHVFARRGFTCVSRPAARHAIMRRDLTG